MGSERIVEQLVAGVRLIALCELAFAGGALPEGFSHGLYQLAYS